MDPNWQISCVRTVVVPLFIGLAAQFLVFLGGGPGPILRVAATALFGMGWYVLARLAQYHNPQLGCLLGVSVRPRYDVDDLSTSLRRTLVPLAVAAVICCLATATLSGSTPALLLVAVALAYYGSLRWVEQRSTPDSTARGAAGWLLGARAVPHY